MEFRPCLVIPNYNHGYALEAIVQAVAPLGLQTIVVNDASTDSTAETLERLTARCPWLSAIHRQVNGGKGAAIRDGLATALERGFSHAVCIDGDGQHTCADLPKFLSCAEHNPQHLILGTPRFGADAPLTRRVGREFSNILVAASTWSLQARDVLCGFRVYPLASVVSNVNLMALEPRMGFDVEVVVRALWAGIPIKNIPTEVSYPTTGVSHFRYGRDNLTMARLFTQLVVVGLWRGPLRIARALGAAKTKPQWHQINERGSTYGLRLLLSVFELLGRRVLLVFTAPIVCFFFLLCGTPRRAAVDFQRRLARERGQQISPLMAHCLALRQFWEFGRSIVDKVISWRHGLSLDRFTWKGLAEVKALLASNRGVIFMGAHVGNLEVIRAFGDTRNVPIHALMFTEHSKKFKNFLEEVNEQSFLRVHDLQTVDAALVFTLQEAIERGECVALLGDRVPKLSSSRSIMVPLLGDDAPLPEGPWILASMLDAPVFSVFSMRGGDGLYHVEFELLAERVELPREHRNAAIRMHADRFAQQLTAIVKRYPYQWYNFFDFWHSSTRSPKTHPEAAQPPLLAQ